MKCDITIAGAASLLLASAGHGAFTHISAQLTPNDHGVLVFDVYANFDNPNDTLIAVAGTPGSPMNIEFTDGAFYQNAFGGDLAPDSAFVKVFPSLAFDSFVTIGKTTSNGDETDLIPGRPGFGKSSLGGNSLGWFIAPGDPQGKPVNGRVLLGRFSTENAGLLRVTGIIQAISDGDLNFQTEIDFVTVDFNHTGACCLPVDGTCVESLISGECYAPAASSSLSSVATSYPARSRGRVATAAATVSSRPRSNARTAAACIRATASGASICGRIQLARGTAPTTTGTSASMTFWQSSCSGATKAAVTSTAAASTPQICSASSLIGGRANDRGEYP